MIIPPMVKVILLLTKSASLFRDVELFGEVFESMISQGLKRNKIKLIFQSFKDKSFPQKRWIAMLNAFVNSSPSKLIKKSIPINL